MLRNSFESCSQDSRRLVTLSSESTDWFSDLKGSSKYRFHKLRSNFLPGKSMREKEENEDQEACGSLLFKCPFSFICNVAAL
jgi:hypothetical protein